MKAVILAGGLGTRISEGKLRGYVQRVGLYKTKARHIIQTCRLLLENHDGKVPQTREELESLPGVGRKTANVVHNTAFGQPTIAVDTHIFRVSNRTGLAPGKTTGRGIVTSCSKIYDFHCNIIYASQAAGNLPAEIKHMLRIKIDQLESTSQRLMSRCAKYDPKTTS